MVRQSGVELVSRRRRTSFWLSSLPQWEQQKKDLKINLLDALVLFEATSPRILFKRYQEQNRRIRTSDKSGGTNGHSNRKGEMVVGPIELAAAHIRGLRRTRASICASAS